MRRALDHYPTPQVAIGELLDEIGPQLTIGGRVIDPSAGRGALLDGVKIRDPFRETLGVEIDTDNANYVRRAHPCMIGDYLNYPLREQRDTALFLSNPPYSLAQEFVTKMLAERGPSTVVAVLLRLGFLASQKRENWWRANPPAALRILSKRPSFTGDGKTDNSDYAWFIWQPVGCVLNLRPLDWYSGCE